MINLIGGVALLLWGLRTVRIGISDGWGSEIRSALGVSGRTPLPEFEAVVTLVTVGGSSISTELIAIRRITNDG